MFREPFAEPKPDTIKMRLINSVENLDGCANKDEVRDAIARITELEDRLNLLNRRLLTSEVEVRTLTRENESLKWYHDYYKGLVELLKVERANDE